MTSCEFLLSIEPAGAYAFLTAIARDAQRAAHWSEGVWFLTLEPGDWERIIDRVESRALRLLLATPPAPTCKGGESGAGCGADLDRGAGGCA